MCTLNEQFANTILAEIYALQPACRLQHKPKKLPGDFKRSFICDCSLQNSSLRLLDQRIPFNFEQCNDVYFFLISRSMLLPKRDVLPSQGFNK